MTCGYRGVLARRIIRSSRTPLISSLLALTITAVGCSRSWEPSAAAVTANTAATDGLAALEKKDWKTAEELLTTAINAGVLSGDQYEAILLGRARARIELGEYASAADDLLPLEFEAAALDQVLMLKCELALRQKNLIVAQHAYEQAKKINPKLPKPDGLK